MKIISTYADIMRMLLFGRLKATYFENPDRKQRSELISFTNEELSVSVTVSECGTPGAAGGRDSLGTGLSPLFSRV